MLWPALIDEPHLRTGGGLRLHGSFGEEKKQERNTRRMFNHFVISENQKRCLFGVHFYGCSLTGGGGLPCILPWPQLHTHERYATLQRWEGCGGKYPIIHFQIKTQRSSLMKAVGRDVILSNRKDPTNTLLIKPFCWITLKPKQPSKYIFNTLGWAFAHG